MGREAAIPFSALRLLLLGGLLAVFWLALGAGEARAANSDTAGSDRGSGLGSSLSLPSPPVLSTVVPSVAAAAVPEPAQETAGPTAPVPGAVSAPATQTVASITAPASPNVNAVAAPITSLVNEVSAPVTSVVNAVAAPVAPVVSAVAAPVTSVVSAVAAPVTPVLDAVAVPVGGVVGSVIPVVDAVTAPVVSAVDVSGPGLTGPAQDGLTNPVLTQPAGSNNGPSAGTAPASDPVGAASDSSTAVNGVSSKTAELATVGTPNAVRLPGTPVRSPHSLQQLQTSDPFQFPVPDNRANLPVPLTSGAGGASQSNGNGSAGFGQHVADLSYRFILPTGSRGDGSPFSFALPGAPDQDPGYSPD